MTDWSEESRQVKSSEAANALWLSVSHSDRLAFRSFVEEGGAVQAVLRRHRLA
jgi:hypothetical protein